MDSEKVRKIADFCNKHDDCNVCPCYEICMECAVYICPSIDKDKLKNKKIPEVLYEQEKKERK